jgi:hypothetical protein
MFIFRAVAGRVSLRSTGRAKRVALIDSVCSTCTFRATSGRKAMLTITSLFANGGGGGEGGTCTPREARRTEFEILPQQ